MRYVQIGNRLYDPSLFPLKRQAWDLHKEGLSLSAIGKIICRSRERSRQYIINWERIKDKVGETGTPDEA